MITITLFQWVNLVWWQLSELGKSLPNSYCVFGTGGQGISSSYFVRNCLHNFCSNIQNLGLAHKKNVIKKYTVDSCFSCWILVSLELTDMFVDCEIMVTNGNLVSNYLLFFWLLETNKVKVDSMAYCYTHLLIFLLPWIDPLILKTVSGDNIQARTPSLHPTLKSAGSKTQENGDLTSVMWQCLLTARPW